MSLLGIGLLNEPEGYTMEQESQANALRSTMSTNGIIFPGYNYTSNQKRTWMAELDPSRVHVYQIVWPGTHHSGTNTIGATLLPTSNVFKRLIGNFTDEFTIRATRPFVECQTETIYNQLSMGVRALDIHVGSNMQVKNRELRSYHAERVVNELIQFLEETQSEIIIIHFRTQQQEQSNPSGFDDLLVRRLRDYLIPPNDGVFNSTIAQLLPKRVICVWQPLGPFPNRHGNMLWNPRHIREDPFQTQFPKNKFDRNLNFLKEDNSMVSRRNYFTKIDNTLTSPRQTIHMLNELISPFARLFVSRAFNDGDENSLQIFSTDLIKDDFVDACIGATHGRINGP